MRDFHDVAIPLELVGNLRFEPADREHLGRLQARGILRAERVGESPLLVGREPIGMIPGVRLVDADDLRVALVDQLAESFVLRVVVRLHQFEEPVVVEPADRHSFDRLPAARVGEHENRPAPRRERGERRHRSEHRIVVVLARHDDPHVDPLARHQRGQHRVEPLGNPALDDWRLLAMREDTLRGIGIVDALGRKRDDPRGENQSGYNGAHIRAVYSVSRYGPCPRTGHRETQRRFFFGSWSAPRLFRAFGRNATVSTGGRLKSASTP